MTKNKNQAKLLKITGLVQGVGFRPFIYKSAVKSSLSGWVKNINDGVEIKIQGKSVNINEFIKALKKDAPVNSKIEKISVKKSDTESISGFNIIKSKNISNEITEISPDIAVCSDCLDDMKRQKNRLNYPFINCTNCGPRFSITRDLPYDRKMTTMNVFKMCGSCSREYNDIGDRRFHAQPIACSKCGPEYTLLIDGKKIRGITDIISMADKLLSGGEIIALKGQGGYNLICDAFNETAVKRLREYKRRENKPFAVMFSDEKKLAEYAFAGRKESEIITGWKRPIVLLKQKKIISDLINCGLDTIGAILPYMPLHYLLFSKIKTCALVFTSGNEHDEPIVTDDREAGVKFKKIAAGIMSYNRDIYNRVDDSIVEVINGKEVIFRRSRGYAPSSIKLKFRTEGILALGAELKNTFCIGRNNYAILSQHIGDLKNLETYEFYKETIDRFKRLYRFAPDLVVCDLHPDYLSTIFAIDSKLELIRVQHHKAHIASCMAEHGLDERVIGISFDGTGYGEDGNIWGGEFFINDLINFRRYSYFDYTLLQGGDKAIKEPWRAAVSYLYMAYGSKFISMNLPFLKRIKTSQIELSMFALKNRINSFLTSSAGRFFDAVSAMMGLCLYSTFEAEAPIRLESIIAKNIKDHYDFIIGSEILIDKIIEQITGDIINDADPGIISANFDNTIIQIIKEISIKIRLEENINKVVLSGGVFQNKYILENTVSVLKENKFIVYSHNLIPTNDACIALGQLAIAAKRRKV